MAGIGAVILAAGGSTRMSIPKQLLRFRGQTLLRRAASTALEAAMPAGRRGDRRERGGMPGKFARTRPARGRESAMGIRDEFVRARRHRSTCHAESPNRRGRPDVM